MIALSTAVAGVLDQIVAQAAGPWSRSSAVLRTNNESGSRWAQHFLLTWFRPLVQFTHLICLVWIAYVHGIRQQRMHLSIVER